MKYLRVFENDAEYQAFKVGGDYVTPNICLNKENGIINIQDNRILTFTIDNKEYNFEDGMTWKEFINSKYNDGCLSIYSYYVFYKNTNNGLFGRLYLNKVMVNNTDLVKEENYLFDFDGGGEN